MIDMDVVGNNGVHMYGGGTVQLFLQLFFDIVYLIVDLQDIAACRHLGVEGDHETAGTIVMDDQVMNALDRGVSGDKGLDILYKVLLGRLPKQGIHGYRYKR